MRNRAARRAAMRNQKLSNVAATATSIPAAESQTSAAPPTPSASASATNEIPQQKTFAATADGPSVETESETPSSTISEARLAANRANAQHSSGPRSAAGRAKSSLNALKTGLCGQTVVLPTDDLAAYEAHLARYFAKFSPVGDDEHTLVQIIADTVFRLLRIAPLEAGIISLGHREFAHEFEDETNPTTRAGLIKAKIMVHYRRDLSNLALQERRLRNHLEKDTAELEAIQTLRRSIRRQQINHWTAKLEQGHPFDPLDAGFEFSTNEIQAYLKATAVQFKLTDTRPCFDKFLLAFRKEQKAS